MPRLTTPHSPTPNTKPYAIRKRHGVSGRLMKNTAGKAHSEKRMPARMKGSTDFRPILITEKFSSQMTVIRTASARCLNFIGSVSFDLRAVGGRACRPVGLASREPLLHEVDSQHRLHWKRRTPSLTFGCM